MASAQEANDDNLKLGSFLIFYTIQYVECMH